MWLQALSDTVVLLQSLFFHTIVWNYHRWRQFQVGNCTWFFFVKLSGRKSHWKIQTRYYDNNANSNNNAYDNADSNGHDNANSANNNNNNDDNNNDNNNNNNDIQNNNANNNANYNKLIIMLMIMLIMMIIMTLMIQMMMMIIKYHMVIWLGYLKKLIAQLPTRKS